MGGNADSPGAGGTSVSPSTGGLVDGGAGGGSGIYSVFLNGGVGGEAIGTSCLSHAGALGVDGSLGTGGGAFTAGGGGGSGYYGGGQVWRRRHHQLRVHRGCGRWRGWFPAATPRPTS